MSDQTEDTLISGLGTVNAIASLIVTIMVEKGVISADEVSLRFQTLSQRLAADSNNQLGANMALQVAQVVETTRRDRPQVN
jgi:hypothetical protein